jgi:hypothetical protein
VCLCVGDFCDVVAMCGVVEAYNEIMTVEMNGIALCMCHIRTHSQYRDTHDSWNLVSV